MEKSVSGIIKRNKRSIQELKQRRDKAGEIPSKKNGNSSRRPPSQRGDEQAATFGFWFVGVVAIVFLFFLFSVIFAETTVTVYPKTADIEISDTYTASRSDATAGVNYSVVGVEESIDIIASTTGSEYREESASGEIIIYNNYSTESLQLVSSTRFQTADGLIYRTRESAVVPGKSGEQPGTVTATVYADEVGSQYNIGQTDFSIPGFAGTAYEELVYAESTAGMTGGIAAEVPVVATSTRQEVESQAAEELRDQLTTRIIAELPEGFVIYDDGIYFSAEITGSGEETADGATLTVTGRLQAVAFDGRQLSTYLATNYSDDISTQDDIRIQNLENFTFAIQDKDQFDISSDSGFNFSLAGDSQIVWQYDERALVRDLRGLQKDRLNEVLVNYAGIQEAEVVTRPFWKQTLPSNAEEITIVRNLRD